MTEAFTVRTGLWPETWTEMADTIAENDPLREGTRDLGGCDLVVVGYRDGAPIGFIAGRSQQGAAVCSFVRLRKVAFGSRVTVRALFEAWATQAAHRGHQTIVAGVPKDPPTYRRIVEIMLREAGFTLYHEGDAERDWFRAAVPRVRRPTPPLEVA